MNSIEVLAVIALFTAALYAMAWLLCNVGAEAQAAELPLIIEQSVLTMNKVKRTKSGDLAFYHTNNATGEQYYRVGIQWKTARTHKIVSKKSIGL